MGKPLPLKQRTSSVDQRSDFTHHAWTSLLGLLKPREFFITADHFSLWRRHLVWAKQDGKELRDHMTQRFSSNMVFMSLFLASELNILFSSSQIATTMRADMMETNHHKISFWVGIVIILSVVFTLLTLLSTLTAWAMVSSLSDKNALYILRSSIGLYAAHLPARLTLFSIYTFFTWVVMYLFVLLPNFYSKILMVFFIVLFLHVVIVFSALGRLIMHTGAMGSKEIFDTDLEQQFLPRNLHNHLLSKAYERLESGTSITRQYNSFSETRTKPSIAAFPLGLNRQTSVRFSDETEVMKIPSFESSFETFACTSENDDWTSRTDEFGESLYDTMENGVNHHRRISSLSVGGPRCRMPEFEHSNRTHGDVSKNPIRKNDEVSSGYEPEDRSDCVEDTNSFSFVEKANCTINREDKRLSSVTSSNESISTENSPEEHRLEISPEDCPDDYVHSFSPLNRNSKEDEKLLSGTREKNYSSADKPGILYPRSIKHKKSNIPGDFRETVPLTIGNGLYQWVNSSS